MDKNSRRSLRSLRMTRPLLSDQALDRCKNLFRNEIIQQTVDRKIKKKKNLGGEEISSTQVSSVICISLELHRFRHSRRWYKEKRQEENQLWLLFPFAQRLCQLVRSLYLNFWLRDLGNSEWCALSFSRKAFYTYSAFIEMASKSAICCLVAQEKANRVKTAAVEIFVKISLFITLSF